MGTGTTWVLIYDHMGTGTIWVPCRLYGICLNRIVQSIIFCHRRNNLNIYLVFDAVEDRSFNRDVTYP